MPDIKFLREKPEEAERKLASKDPTIRLEPILRADEEVRALKSEVEALKNKKNIASKRIGELKSRKESADDLMREVARYGEEIGELDRKLRLSEEKFQHRMAELPNFPCDEAKVSLDPEDNVCLKERGSKPVFSFPIKNHLELNEKLGLFDFERGAKITGSGWPVYGDRGFRLEWALINMMLDFHLSRGFSPRMLPLMVREEMMYGAGQYPKFKDQAYALQDGRHAYSLIPTAEVALNALHYDEVLEDEDLPLKYVAYTPCFRREAGAAGGRERGLIRTHQFNKVEMFAFARPDQSDEIFDDFVVGAETLIEMLELPYKRMSLVTGDMSFAAAKTIDLEVWLPGQDRYMEVSSISHCSDFQTARSNICRKDKSGKRGPVHTLNGSGLATSRIMVALLENHQREDGSVYLPEALRKYLGGMDYLRADG